MTLKISTQIPTELLLRIQIRNKQRRYKIDRLSAAVFCSTVLHEIGESDPALSVAFVSSLEMRRINTRFLHKNYATDVLSFAYDEEKMDGLPFLGDIVIAPEVSYRNAVQFRIHPDREIKKLLIHGILHLLGFDHETDSGKMQQLQTRIIRRAFFRKSSSILKE